MGERSAEVGERPAPLPPGPFQIGGGGKEKTRGDFPLSPEEKSLAMTVAHQAGGNTGCEGGGCDRGDGEHRRRMKNDPEQI